MTLKCLYRFNAMIFLIVLHSAAYANQQVIQEVLDGSEIPKFVEPLTTFNGKRVDGKKHLQVIATEFQQKILPSSFYESLPCSVEYKSVATGKKVFCINPRKGTYLWGYKIKAGRKIFEPYYPAHTIEAQQGIKTKVKYVNHLNRFKDKKGRILPGPLLQKFLTVDLSVCWGNPLNYPMVIPGIHRFIRMLFQSSLVMLFASTVKAGLTWKWNLDAIAFAC